MGAELGAVGGMTVHGAGVGGAEVQGSAVGGTAVGGTAPSDTAVGGTTVERTVDAVNRLTARWADAATGGTVFSAAGVWPLLAFLADGAWGAARAELADAVGM